MAYAIDQADGKDLHRAILAAGDAIHDAAVVVGRVVDRLETLQKSSARKTKPAQRFTAGGIRQSVTFQALRSPIK